MNCGAEICSETSHVTHLKDLDQKDVIHNVDNSAMLESSCDFEFIVCSNLGHESSSADELFSNGVIVPTQAREGSALQHVKRYHHPKVSVASTPPRPPIMHPSTAEVSIKVLKAGMVSGCDVEDKTKSINAEEFPRSSSLRNEAKKSLLCSLSLLPRSSSVGSVPNQKKTMSKDKQNSQRRSPFSLTRSFSFSSNSSTSQKPPSSKKSHSPVLNVQSSSIGIGASNLFGLSCFLSGSRKDQRSK